MLDALRFVVRALCRSEFAVRISGGSARLVRGKLRARVVDDFAAIARSRGIEGGSILGVARPGRGTVLVFSPGIADADRQRFRNAFAAA